VIGPSIRDFCIWVQTASALHTSDEQSKAKESILRRHVHIVCSVKITLTSLIKCNGHSKPRLAEPRRVTSAFEVARVVRLDIYCTSTLPTRLNITSLLTPTSRNLPSQARSQVISLESHNTTANLLSLPIELIVLILASCPVQTATRLAIANKELHAIWLKHNDHILESMFKETFPASAHEDAIDFRDLQNSLVRREQFINATQQGPSVVDQPSPTAPFFGQLLRDATLAVMTVASWRVLPHTRMYTDAYGSYYFVRKLVLAGRHQNEPLKGTLFSTLSRARSTPTQTPFSHVDLCNFICGYARDLEPGVAHGVWTPEKDENTDDEDGSNDDDDGEDESGDCNEDDDVSGDGEEEESDGAEGGFTPRTFYDGRTPEWKYAVEVLEAARGLGCIGLAG
jgi:hypothetical protein